MNSYLFAYNLAFKYSLFPCLGESANLGEKQMARKGGPEEKGRALEKWYFRDWQEETEIRVKKKKTKGKHVNLRWCVIFCDGISVKMWKLV